MKRILKTPQQVEKFSLELNKLMTDKGLMVEVKEYKPPRTLTQSAKLHAMLADLALWEQVTPAAMKSFIKTLEFWPVEAVKGKYVPMSEADLTRDQESEIIEMLYVIAAQELEPSGFKWTDEIGDNDESNTSRNGNNVHSGKF